MRRTRKIRPAASPGHAMAAARVVNPTRAPPPRVCAPTHVGAHRAADEFQLFLDAAGPCAGLPVGQCIMRGCLACRHASHAPSRRTMGWLQQLEVRRVPHLHAIGLVLLNGFQTGSTNRVTTRGHAPTRLL
jgi:hypothetical protein